MITHVPSHGACVILIIIKKEAKEVWAEAYKLLSDVKKDAARKTN